MDAGRAAAGKALNVIRLPQGFAEVPVPVKPLRNSGFQGNVSAGFQGNRAFIRHPASTGAQPVRPGQP